VWSWGGGLSAEDVVVGPAEEPADAAAFGFSGEEGNGDGGAFAGGGVGEEGACSAEDGELGDWVGHEVAEGVVAGGVGFAAVGGAETRVMGMASLSGDALGPVRCWLTWRGRLRSIMHPGKTTTSSPSRAWG
jgi:hypothetical protein